MNCNCFILAAFISRFVPIPRSFTRLGTAGATAGAPGAELEEIANLRRGERVAESLAELQISSIGKSLSCWTGKCKDLRLAPPL